MIIPNRIMNRGTCNVCASCRQVFFDDDCRHIKLAQTGPKRDAALTATNNDTIGLTRVTY